MTKNKLNAFNFAPAVKSNTTETPSGNENLTAQDDDDESTSVGEVSLPEAERSSGTSGSRLAWHDLIGAPQQKDDQQDVTPNERLSWDTGHGQSYKASPMISRKRGKKRARSSSPTSSPTKSKSNTPVVNVKKLAEALKSPHADPALELWDRFSLSGSTSATPLGANNPALAQIMASSSPRPSKMLGAIPAEGGLRRTTSCGAQWPKRRRTDRTEPLEPLEVMVEESPSGASKSSMVNALLKSVTGEINRSKVVRQEILKSPSPKKTRRHPTPSAPSSPSQPPPSSPLKRASPLLDETDNSKQGQVDPILRDSSASDYGDDDFDDDAFMELDASLAVPGGEVDDGDATLLAVAPPPPDTGQQTGQSALDDDLDAFEDEFADLDDDVFAVAEDLISQIESNHTPTSNADTLPEPVVAPQNQVDVISEDATEDLYGDDFGGDFDFEAAEIAATQSAKQTQLSGSLPPPTYKPKTIQRYLVTKVLQSQYTDDRGRESLEKVLLVQVDRSTTMKMIHLRGDWVDTPASDKAYVHVIGGFESSGQCIIDNSQNILILHPDQLISATVVADSFTCMRRAVLQDRVKATSDKTPPLVYGTLLHEIFQEALTSNQWSLEFLDSVICRITERHVEDLYTIKVSLPDAREHLRSKMTELKHWAAAFVSPYPRPDAVVQGRNGDKANMCISKLLDVEEHVWSPMYGMKGNIDATVQVTMKDGPQHDGNEETSGMKGKFEEVVQHLTPTHREFFLKWEDLLTKEEKQSQRLRRELWTMLSSEREKVGRCFGDVIIEEGSASEDVGNPKINRYRYTFVKENTSPGFSFLDSQLATGEPIVVSDEKGHFALALGFVTSVRKHKISVAVDRRLHNARIRQPGFDETKNQVFASIMEVVPEGATPAESQGRIKAAPVKYRVDKDEFSSGMATVRNNLVQVMANDVFGSKAIRRLVVDLAPPKFKTITTQYTLADQGSLNVDQRAAIAKVMSANDYALVLGMPGTGKTTTIAHIIRALVCQGKSVLLTSYTHSAVDNILLKLKNDQIPILRLGAPVKVHPEVQDFAVLAGQPKNSFEEIRSAWHETPIVATTCLGVNHPVFSERTFDYCIVDEASQITLPICLGPIRMARTFVLVGDHNQLPPLVQNEEARTGGLDISLFKLLSDTHPSSVVNLEHQYRMCEDIMALSNTLIYKGRLKCGTEALRNQKLDVPHMEALQHRHYDSNTILRPGTPRSICTGWSTENCWLRSLIDPEARVLFVNTDSLPSSREEAKGNRIVNPTEARIVTQLVDALLDVGVPASEIGVMTHYRSQLSLLKHGLRRHGSSIELHTADRFQGRDKEVVVLSLVRSNEACNIGDLLKDWRRINVAFTRAKTKLLVVGSRDTLKGSGEQEMLSKFVKLMEEREWVYDLPSDALDVHFFDDSATQLTATCGLKTEKRTVNDRSSPKKTVRSSLKSTQAALQGKENQGPGVGGPRKAKVTDRALLKGQPILRDIWNDIADDI
ncbi:DNA replication endonuclease-helicase Dna2 [Diatrype stigma]|uniref:DNA replication ATP-dependent helicase/nuclease n=1 Tax=Diatrype stigma TaxID=117547 RepID=A0AAN9YGL2_9PEZI